MKDIAQSPKLELPPALQFLSTLEVAIILGVSRKLVNGWVNDGKLPAFRISSVHPHGRGENIKQRSI